MCIRFASRNCNDGAGAHGRFGGGAVKPYYEHAGITIYHGDCREILPTLPKCDLLLTDPPYGMKWDASTKVRGFFKGDKRIRESATVKWGPIIGDDEPFNPSFMLGCAQ